MGFSRGFSGETLTENAELIMKSGLLLDEDFELLLANQPQYTVEKTTLKKSVAKIFFSIVPAATTTIFVNNKLALVYPALALIPFAAIVIEKSVSSVKRFRRKQLIRRVIMTFQRLGKLNVQVLQYAKQCNIIPAEYSELPHNIHIKYISLIKTTIQKELQLIHLLLIYIQELFDNSKSTYADYSYLQQVNFEKYSSILSNNIEEYTGHLQSLNDIFTLVVSHFLTSLSTAFLASCEKNIDKTLSVTEKLSRETLEVIGHTFRNVQFSSFTKRQVETPLPKLFGSERLKNDLLISLSNLNNLIELSKSTFNKLESRKNKQDKEHLLRDFSELRDSVSDYHNSLNDFVISFEKYTSANQQKTIHEEVQLPISNSCDAVKTDVQTFTEPEQDEEYEFNAEDDDADPQHYWISTEGLTDGIETQNYAPGLYHELKKHDKFVAAGKRFKVDNTVPVEQNNAPAVTNDNENHEIILPASCVPLPPPPPPPMPKIEINPEELTDDKGHLRLSLAAISSRRGHTEEVFQDET